MLKTALIFMACAGVSVAVLTPALAHILIPYGQHRSDRSMSHAECMERLPSADDQTVTLNGVVVDDEQLAELLDAEYTDNGWPLTIRRIWQDTAEIQAAINAGTYGAGFPTYQRKELAR